MGHAAEHSGDNAAIRRALDIYYRDAARTRRMDRLNASFVPPRGLAFDLGAHVGDRTGSFRRLGASVVALEPQPRVFRTLRMIYGREADVALCAAAVGAGEGYVDMYVNSTNPTVSTLSTALVEAAPSNEAWRDQTWDQTIRVRMTTIDALIAQYGRPDFVKIDVEGHEVEVLRGLSSPLPALSFEVTTLLRKVARPAIERLADLGHYVFNISLGEEHRLRMRSWISGEEMCDLIDGLPHDANSGDVYAWLRRDGDGSTRLEPVSGN